jgi:hypothetical protein
MTVATAQAALDDAARGLGAELGVDGVALLHERAAILGIAPNGTVSAGGTARLLPARDGWVAMNLARRTDVELLAAWMGYEWDGPAWDAVAAALSTMDAEPAAARAQLLGIPAAVAVAAPEVAATPVEPGSRGGVDPRPLVVDLSALWAGPLCGRLLAARGARVVKVEDAARPDGARAGPPAFWDRLNAAKEQRALDFGAPAGRSALTRLLDQAAVVVTSARRRALEQLGLDLVRRVRVDGLIWVAITGYGYEHEWRDRVAFGDDAAVAGGLAVAAGGPDAPVFVGDAPADPLAGMTGAAVAARLLERGRGGFVDVALRDVVATALTGARYAADVPGPREPASRKQVA